MTTLLLALLFPLYAQTKSCEISPLQLNNFLMMDYMSFDQTLGGGWRTVIQNDQCYVEAAMLIDTYHFHHKESFKEKWYSKMSYWHAGQMYAFADLYGIAISRFEKSYEPKDSPSFKWNSYVSASIAFLKRDKKELLKHYEELKTATDDGAKRNLALVKNMVDCFEKTYREVYSNPCRKK